MLPGVVAPASGAAGPERRLPVTEAGAVGDGASLQTAKIQAAVDRLAAEGGGTVVIPKGVFLSGALFLKPGVNLHLDEGAVLKGSPDIKDYPKLRTRIEGHFEDWLPALVNADHADHLVIDGPGMLDGSGAGYWAAFWAARKADPKVTNLAVERPRLMLVQNSRDVRIAGLTFHNSGFWNLHLYRSSQVLVEGVRFEVEDGVKCPSTDGTDIDSCQDVRIHKCSYRVNDDCVALKGSKGPLAAGDKDSPPVERIRVSECVFERGGATLTLGSEATVVRDVLVTDCKVTGAVHVALLKLRPDTPQHYENIRYRNIELNGASSVIRISPWKQFFDLKGQAPPHSVVDRIVLQNIHGTAAAFGVIQGNPGQTEIGTITLEAVDVQVKDARLKTSGVKHLRTEGVLVNGRPPVIDGPHP